MSRLNWTGLTRWLLCLPLFAVCAAVPDLALAASQQVYDFKVQLDGKDIGSQRFDVSSEGDRTEIAIKASFDVKFFFLTAYSYRHTNREVWKGDCLKEIRATTNDNGDEFFVRGTYTDGRLQLETHAGSRTVEGCVKTFAYWNRDWVQSPRLLNSQTGAVDEVQIREIGEETIEVRGVPTSTEHIRIKSDKLTIDLWYDRQQSWVGLQSTTEDGGVLTYQLL